jgi:hypothetical protein
MTMLAAKLLLLSLLFGWAALMEFWSGVDHGAPLYVSFFGCVLGLYATLGATVAALL